MLDILLIAVCSGVTAVIGLAACFCIVKKRRSTRFASFFSYFLNLFVLRKPGLITCPGYKKNDTGIAFNKLSYLERKPHQPLLVSTRVLHLSILAKLEFGVWREAYLEAYLAL